MRTVYILLVLLFVVASNGTASLIQWSGVQDITQLGSDWPETWHLLDVDGNGVDDFNLHTEVAGFFIEHIGAFGPNMWVVNINELGWFGGVIPLSSDTLIGSDTLPDDRGWRDTDVKYTFMQDGTTGIGGPWVGVAHGILGLHFDIDGERHYGWADISYDNDWTMTLHSWAYETQAGVPIMAGAVPEPSTWALFLCGAACLLGKLRQFQKGAQGTQR